jgi:hypothetical protein
MIQTAIAILVMVAYYAENRARLLFLLNKEEVDTTNLNLLKIFNYRTWVESAMMLKI